MANNRPKFLKNLLTTASALAVLAGGASSAVATERLTTGAATVPAVANLNPLAWANGDVIKIANAAHKLATSGAVTIGAINVNGMAVAAPIDIRHAAIIGSIADVTGGNGYVDVDVSAGVNLTLNGAASAVANNIVAANIYTGLRNISLADKAAQLTINPNGGVGNTITLGGTINGGAPGQGEIILEAGNTVFNGTIGNANGIQKLTLEANAQATLNANAKFDDTVGAGGIVVANNSTLTVAAGVNITTNDTNANALAIDGAAPNNGTLVFQGASTVGIGIGTGVKLASVQINNGTVDFQGSANNGGNNLKATNFALNHANAVMKLSTLGHVVEGDISTTTDLTGILQLDGDFAHSIAGKVGLDNTHRLAAINFTTAGANSKLELLPNAGGNAAFNVKQVTTDTDGKGTISFGANAIQTITGTIGMAGGNKLASVIIHSNDGAGTAATTVTLQGDANPANASKIYATEVDLAGAAVDNILILGQNTLIDGKVSTGNANNGIIQVNGDSTITGTIGEANAINAINFNAGNTTLTVQGNTVKTTNGIAFGGNNSILAFNQDQATTVKVGGNGITATNVGKITTAVTGANIFEIQGKIGADAANRLATIEAKNGGTLKLSGGDAYIQTIDMTTNDGILELGDAAGRTYAFELKHSDGQGTIKIAGDTTFAEGIKLNADVAAGANQTNFLKEIRFTNGGASNTLTFAKSINLYLTNGITTGNINKGQLVFNDGASVIYGSLGASNAKLDALALNGANTSLELKNDAYFNGAITLDNKTTLKIGGNLTANSIVGKAAHQGTVEFTNAAPINVTTAVGVPGNAVNLVKISGGNNITLVNTPPFPAVVNADLIADEINFANNANNPNGAVTLTLPTKVNLNTIKVSIADGNDQKHTIAVNEDQTITGQIGTDATHRLNSIYLLGDNTVNINTMNFFSGVTTKTNSTGTVNLNMAGSTINGDLGGDAALLKVVNVNENITIAGSTYATDVKVIDQKTAIFNGDVTGTTLTLGAANGANVTFGDNSALAINIVTGAAGKGQVTFNGSALVSNIGKSGQAVQSVTFVGDNKTIALTGDIYSGNTIFPKSNVNIDAANVLISGPVNATGTTVTLASGNLKFDDAVTASNNTIELTTNDVTFSGAGKVSTFTGDVQINTTFDGTNSGQVIVDGNGTKLDASGANSITFGLRDTSTTRPGPDGNTITIATTANNGLIVPAAKAQWNLLTEKNLFVKWIYNGLTATQLDNAAEATNQILAGLGADKRTSENAFKLVNMNNTGKAAEYAEEFISLGRSGDHASFKESIERFEHPIVTGTQAVATVIGVTTEAIASRISSVAAPVQLQVAQGPVEGVAAGDSSTALTAASYGAWGSPFYSQGVQKMRKGVSGYKVKSYGGTLGFDTMANDTMTVGVALTAAKTDLKHKNINAGDKTKADTLMFSIYGVQQVTDNWFVQGIASFGSSKIKNNAKRIGAMNGARNVQTASAKYDSMSYGGEVLAGYNFKLSEMALVTPMFGLGYTKFNDSGYTETGTRNQNQTVSKKSTDKLEAIIGARVVAAGTDMNGIIVTPEVHGFIRQALTNKTPKVDMRLDGLVNPITPKTAKAAKTFYNVGLGLNARAGMMEYGASYDAHLANKYVGHQGTLKVRVNF